MNSVALKLSLIKLLKFLLIFVLIDQLLGFVAHKLFLSQETGKFARSTYVINHSNDEVLLLGSSHTIRQYVPQVVEKKTGLTCYNAGAEGQQLLYQTALLQMILKRAKPKLIVLNIDAHWLYESDVAYSRLNDLNSYYSKHYDVLYPKLKERSQYVPIKMFFRAFQENSTLVHIVRYFFAPQVSFKGYRPLYGKMTEFSNEILSNEAISDEIDPFFVKNLKLFIDTAKEKGVNLIFTTSPFPVKRDYSTNISFQKIKKIAKRSNVPFYDHLNDERFIGNYNMFNDPTHLNHEATLLFTSIIADHIITEFPDLVKDSE